MSNKWRIGICIVAWSFIIVWLAFLTAGQQKIQNTLEGDRSLKREATNFDLELLATRIRHKTPLPEIEIGNDPAEDIIQSLNSPSIDSVMIALRVLMQNEIITDAEAAEINYQKPYENSLPTIQKITRRVRLLDGFTREKLGKDFDQGIWYHSPHGGKWPGAEEFRQN